MLRVTTVQTEWQQAQFCSIPGTSALEEQLIMSQRPDRQLLLIDEPRDGPHGVAVGRCSVWWNHVPALEGHKVGLIGHYGINDAGINDAEAGASLLLESACRQLAQQGCSITIGPMDGNTWQSYRLVTEQRSDPPFFLEPANPASWPQHFAHSGFTERAKYTSALVTELGSVDARLHPLTKRLRTRGIEIRALCRENAEDELERIYQVATASFADNLLYTPLEQRDFEAQYRPILPLLDPKMVMIAEQGEKAVGFLFMVPDLYQRQRGELIDTVILKTVAVLPAYRHLGLGWVLVEQAHAVAHQLGFQRVIHALMHEDNSSRQLSARYSQPMRRYALFAKMLP